MKKYLIKQAKKSLSLFLAVLMLMSCWVWMAPEEAKKAEAAEITPLTQYTVKIVVNFENPCDGGHVTNNGTTVVSSYPSSFKANGDQTLTYTTTAFPTTIFMRFTTNSWSTSKGTIKSISINDHVVQSGGWGFNTTKTLSSGKDDFTFTRSSDTSTNMGGTVDWPMPKTAGFVDSTASGTAQSMSINKIGGTEVNKATSFSYGTYYDQYGVKFTSGGVSDLTKSVWISKTATGEDLGDSNIYYDATKGVVAKPELQLTQVPDANGKFECYLIESYTGKNVEGGEVNSKVSAKYTITFPKYDVVFDAVLDGAEIKDSSGTLGTKTYTASNYHGKDISVPTTAEKKGYTFCGFWSKPQPTSGDASYNALEAEFANPCTSEDYASYKAATGSTEKDGIVTDADGNKWYDAGKALVPADVKTIDVSENYANFAGNWHGWWISDDVKVKFYDVDGAFKGEQVVKAGQTQDAITWPTSSYSTYTSGAFKFTVDDTVWVNTNGDEIKKNSCTFLSGVVYILTPKLTRTEFKNKYTVTFMNPNGGSVGVGTDGSYDYRADIKNYADIAKGKIAATPNDVSSDLEFRYELLGWSSVVPTTGKNYHVLLENANFDVNGTAIGLNSDWVVRSDATYYPVYRRFTKTYVVNFNYKDATGADATRQLKFKYGETLVPPIEYVPYSYVTKGFGYTFNKWAYSNADGDATLDYNATIPFTNEYISIEGAALDGTEGLDPIDITATYGAPVATPYTVTFNYIDSKGEETSEDVEVRNEQFILQDTVVSLKPAEKWENEDQLYTYAYKWEITEGAATVGVGGAEKKVGDIINTAGLITLTPTSNISFKAVYANPVPYFTVTYIDGTMSFKDRVLEGSNVPAWTYEENNDNGTPDDTTDDFKEDKIYVPSDYEGEGGTYEFQGWFNAQTGGNKVTTADKVTSNLTLYSQYKFVPDTFTITFMNHDGSVQLAAGKYEKGQNIEALVTTATKAAQGRAEDNTYKYLFLGWDKAVPSFCEGYDVTYTALYKPVYKYYDVKWYNSKLVDGKWVADKTSTEVDGKTVETNLLATTKHTYNSKLYTPSVGNIVCLEEAPNGQNYVFAGWYYNDAEGNAHKYERGMLVTAEMEFYATFTLSAKTHTVTTVVKGESAKYEVADGNTAEIPVPQAGYVDATKHDAFAGWYTDEAYTTEFNATTAITADITLYAKFEESDHDFSEKELVDAPTYYAEGEMDVWCACDKAKTKKTEAIDMLTDTVIPTGTIYLGDKSWSSEGAAAYETDNDPISIFVNDKTDVIITANDKGDENLLYNPAGLGIGVNKIRAFVFPADKVLTADNYGAAQSLAIDVYNDETQAQTNNANFAVKLGDFVVADLDEEGNPQYENGNVKFKSLESGKSYIIYYYVNDKATVDNGAPATGNQLNRKVRTAKFIYDTKAPIFDVEGSSNEASIPTYCGSATVTGVEADAVLTVNGEVVTATDGEYVINYAEGMDNVIITATDKAGNTFSKKIKVADHSYITTEQAASCGVAGYKKVECIVCRDVKSEETYAALDHIYSIREVIPADCVNIGKVIVTCEICGDKVTTEYEEDGVTPVIPALGHEYAKDAEGNIIYTTVTESTCKTKGLAEAICIVCGEGKITKELDLNPENHEDITITNVEADCVNDGYYTEACSCGVTIKSETYPATGHGTIDEKTAEWYVRTEATCYQTGEKVLKCLVCSNFVEVDGEEVTEVIEATGEHVKTVTNPDTYKEDGEVRYHCATAGCPEVYETKPYVDDSLKEYTVTFKAEDGTVLKEIKALEGTAIAKDAVAAPEKENSTDGKYKYSFAGWKAEDGKTYKLPLAVTSDLVLTASYNETKIMYTHKFVVPNTWTETLVDEATGKVYATLVGGIGDERVPSSTPVFTHKDPATDAELKALYTFEFKGWKNAKGEVVTDFTVAGDAEFTAYFEATPINFEVIFYNGTSVAFDTATVAGGNKVDRPTGIPTKEADDTNHYEFKDWYVSAEAAKAAGEEGEFDFDTAITGTTRIYAGYTAIEHTFETDSEDAATCTEAGKKTEKCACDYIKETVIPALDHDYENGTVITEDMILADGTVIKAESTLCARFEDCGKYLAPETKVAEITFYELSTEEGAEAKKLQSFDVEEGNTVDFTAPEKAKTAQYEYTFVNWTDAKGNIISTNATITVTAGKENADYTANYTATKRTYLVTYFTVDYKALQSKEVKYGDVLPAYTGAVPTKDSTTTDHYKFIGWSISEGTIVKGQLDITPKFAPEAHEWDNDAESSTPPTCTTPGTVNKVCSICNEVVPSSTTSKPLGHKYELVDSKKADYGVEGYNKYVCQNANCPEPEKIEKIPALTYNKLTITVKNGDKAVEDERVSIYGADGFEAHYGTNASGVVVFENLKDGKYRVLVGGIDETHTVKDDLAIEIDLSAGQQGGNDDSTGGCSCSCHRNGFWGMLFRFFHNIIKFFTGEIRCCSNPDSRY